jgi:hypothetical protein
VNNACCSRDYKVVTEWSWQLESNLINDKDCEDGTFVLLAWNPAQCYTLVLAKLNYEVLLQSLFLPKYNKPHQSHNITTNIA